jgi:tetratricopeptide (TPR) repeat protein
MNVDVSMDLGEKNLWYSMRLGLLVLVGSLLSAGTTAQTKVARRDGSDLQQQYDAAQRYQAAQDLDRAAEQYRMFIADALGEIAVARARAGEYDTAADSFDEALRLVPNAPVMRIEYARIALQNGKLDRAKLLATEVIREDRKDSKLEAVAHVILGRVLIQTDKNAEAKQQIEEAVALDPTFDNGYELAVVDLNGGDGKGAEKIFSEMLASFGSTAAIHMRFGQAYLNSDFQENAVTEFQKAIAKNDRLPGAHYSLAAAYLSTAGSTKMVEAEAELRKEISISPKDAEAYAAIGHLLAGQNHDAAGEAEAESYLKRAMALDAKSPDGFFYLGQLYVELKRLPEAEGILRHSILLTTDVSRNGYQVQKAHYLLGRLLMQTDRMDEGKKEVAIANSLMQQNLTRDRDRLSDYLQDHTSGDEATGVAKTTTEQSGLEDADATQLVEGLEKQLGPAIADSYNNLGAISGGQGNSRAALQAFERAAEWNPALPGLDYNWGRAAFAAGEYSQAVSPVTRYLKEHPEDAGARAVLGLSRFLTKDYAGARMVLEPLDGTDGEAPQLRFAYAKSLIETGDVGGGVQRLLVLERKNPNVGEVHRELGEAYVTQNAAGANNEFETAIRLDPSDAEARIALAHLQMKQGNAKAAAANFEVAAKLQPQNAALRQELADANGKAAAQH